MKNRVLLDSNIIIDYLRGRAEAIQFVESLAEMPTTSAVVVAELYAGIREGRERRSLEQLLAKTAILPLDEAFAIDAGLFRRQYGKSHNVDLSDAMIAATAKHAGMRLVTLNKKYFPMLTDVLVPYAKA